jgi:hypothetical protein
MTDIVGERKALAKVGFKHILRESWGSTHDYKSDRTVNRPAKWFFLHISVTADPADNPDAEEAAMRTVERIGIERFGTVGISYNEAAMQSGRLYEGQPLTRRGAHTVNDENNPIFGNSSLNRDARALVIVQNVQDAVTDAQIDAAARWAGAVIRAGEAVPGAKWYGHRDVATKSCPGDKAYARLAELNALTRRYETETKELFVTEDDKTIMRNILKQEVPALVKAAVDDRFSSGGTATRQQIAGTAEITSLIELGLARSATFQELVDKVDALGAT